MVNSVVMVGRVDGNSIGEVAADEAFTSAHFSIVVETAGHVPGRVRISLRGKTARLALDQLRHGMLVGIQGRLVLEACGDGSIEIQATNLRLLGKRETATA